MKVPLLAGWTALALITTGFSQDRATLITQLKTAAETELQAVESKKDEKSEDKASDLGLKRVVSQLQLLPPNATSAELKSVISSLHAITSSPATRQAAEALNAFLQKQAEEAKQKSEIEIETVAQRTAGIGLSARTAKELDAPISELSQMMTEGRPSSGFEAGYQAYARIGVSRLQPLLSWLQNRQEYLMKREAGDQKAARQILQRTSGMNANIVPWIPRTELLALQEADLKAVTPSPEATQKEIEARVGRVAELCRKVLATEDPKTIDPVVEELGELQKTESLDGYNPEIRRVQDAANSAREFAKKWQDFLISRGAGNHEAALGVLSEFTRSGREYPGVARSEIISRAYAEEAAVKAAKSRPDAAAVSVQKILDQMTTLEAMERLLPELEAAGNSTRHMDDTANLSAIQGLSRAYKDFKVAGGTGVSLPVMQMGGGHGIVKKLRDQLTLLIVPALIGAEQADQPKPGEPAQSYLRRLLLAASDKKDWERAERILSTAQKLAIEEPFNRSTDRTAISQLKSGLTLEEGKQYALAVNAYQLALKAGSDLVPVKEIGDRLEAIKKSHPEEYKMGTEQTLNPPRPVGAPSGPAGRRGVGSSYPPGHPMAR